MALNSNFRTLTADNIEGIVEDRNYLKSSFENGTITGWTEVAVALTSGLPTGTPTIGATAASSLALSATSVTPLSGSRSLLVDVPSALTAGHGFISDEFTLDRMDLGKVLTVSFDYERVTGTYNFSGTLGSQTWMVYIYDATAGGANWIQPAGFLGMNQSSGPGRVRATFQSSVTAGQKYRVAVIASQAAAGASSIEFDNFTCSRQTAPIGPVVTDWVSYTPTGNWTTNTSYFGQWRRVGGDIEVRFSASLTGAPNNAIFTVTIPSGLSIDYSRTGAGITPLGFAEGTISGSGYNFQVIGSSSNSVNVIFPNAINDAQAQLSPTLPATWNNGSNVNGYFTAPISGWSSQVQLSNDTDTRVVAMRVGVTTPGGSLSGASATQFVGSPIFDTHGAYDGTSNYTVPVSGYYEVNGSINVTGSEATDQFLTLSAYVNATLRVVGTTRIQNSALTSSPVTVRGMVYCNSGDVITLRTNTNIGTPAFASIGPEYNFFEVRRLSGPSVVAASETVAYSGHRTAGNYAINNSNVTIVFNATGVDTHNAMNTSTGTYTVPVSGLYEVIGKATFTSGSIQLYTVNLFMAGQLTSQSFMTQDSSNGNYRSAHVTNVRRMNAGDQISITAFSSLGSTVVCDSAVTNFLHIKRIGN